MGKIPTYEIEINGLDSDAPVVNKVAFVTSPAIEVGWMAFADDKKKYDFKAIPERRIITGPIIITDLPIYRNTPEEGEFNVVFRKEQSEIILKKFAKGRHYNDLNKQHVAELSLEGAHMIELMMVDSERGIQTPALFDKAPNGSIFMSFWIEDDTLWNEYIMKGRFTGFSIECFMNVLFDKKADKEESLQSAFMRMAEAILKDRVTVF